MTETHNKMLSIWFFVAIVLGAFGLIVLGTGIYHYVAPPANPTHQLPHLHADLWWGIIMVVFSVILFFGDRISSK